MMNLPSSIRDDFPILSLQVYGKPLVYLDNAATTQKPRCVIDAMTQQYLNTNANVHRGVHYLSAHSTDLYEGARQTVTTFLHATSTAEVIFTRGTTESINLVATSFGQAFVHEDDEILVTTMEHHSNIVPWQLLAQRTGAHLRVCPITDDGLLCLDALERLMTPRTRILACTHVSNVLGTLNPIRDIIRIAHSHGIPVLVDAAQSAPHLALDVQDLDCDFLAFSGHKIYGPTGIGVLYGKEKWLEQMPPYMGGGEMIGRVTFERTTYNTLPYKFEAGTPDYIAATGLAQALDYVTHIGLDNIAQHEAELTRYARQRLSEIPGIRFWGPSHTAVVSFTIDGIHPLDIATLIDRQGVALRTGHHCAEPLLHRFGLESTLRASFALYNTTDEIDALVAALHRVTSMFHPKNS